MKQDKELGLSVTAVSDYDRVTPAMVEEIRSASVVAVDTETTGLEYDDLILGVGIAWRGSRGKLSSVYLNLSHVVGLFSSPDDGKLCQAAITAAFTGKERVHLLNSPFDLGKLARWGHLSLDGLDRKTIRDAQLTARLVLPMSLTDGVSMEKLVKRCLGGIPEWVSRAKSDRGSIKYKTADAVQAYGRADAEMTLLLGEYLEELMGDCYDSETGTKLLLRAARFAVLLTEMQNRGVLLSMAGIQRHLDQIALQVGDLERQMAEMGLSRPGSPQALVAALGDAAKFLPKTDKGNPKTDEDTLLACGHPLGKLVVTWRSLMKAKSTWLDGFVDKIASDGRVHPAFRAAGTISGRISCSSPNLQAVPTSDRGHAYGALMDIFGASDGCALYGFDYKQAELRACAAYSGCNVMAEAFESGVDIHRVTAGRMWNIPADEVDKQQRQTAKSANYTITYGGGSGALSESTGIPIAQAKKVMQLHREAFPDLARTQNEAMEVWKSRGYLKLWTGRKRWMADDEQPYKAFNQLQQGNVAEMVVDAMLAVDEYLKATGFGRLVLQIHDSIEAELELQHADEASQRIAELMRGAAPSLICTRTTPPIVFDVDREVWFSPEQEVTGVMP